MKRAQIVHHNEANPVLSKHPAVFHILELLYLRYIYNGWYTSIEEIKRLKVQEVKTILRDSR